MKKTPIQLLHEILDDLEEGVDGHGGTYVNAADWRRLNVVAADIEAECDRMVEAGKGMQGLVEFGTEIYAESQAALLLCIGLFKHLREHVNPLHASEISEVLAVAEPASVLPYDPDKITKS